MAEVKKDGTSLLGKDGGLPPPLGAEPPRGNGQGGQQGVSAPARKPSSEARLPDLWYRRIEGQIEQAEQRYRERRRTREGVMHQLHDEGRTPLEVDTPARVQARLRRLGIESAEGKLCPDTARVLSRV
ncbi:MAG TPA: hypothetical protein VGX50_05690, partial [Longimicrobium sp.]|nr:hypothetical protein [Longimicrobium sp.]